MTNMNKVRLEVIKRMFRTFVPRYDVDVGISRLNSEWIVLWQWMVFTAVGSEWVLCITKRVYPVPTAWRSRIHLTF